MTAGRTDGAGVDVALTRGQGVRVAFTAGDEAFRTAVARAVLRFSEAQTSRRGGRGRLVEGSVVLNVRTEG